MHLLCIYFVLSRIFDVPGLCHIRVFLDYVDDIIGCYGWIYGDDCVGAP